MTTKNSIDESNITDRQYWINKALEEKKVDLKKKKSKANTWVSMFEFAPLEIKKDQEIVLLALANGKEFLSQVLPELINKDFLIKYIDNHNGLYIDFYNVPQELIEDDEIFIPAFKKCHHCFRHLHWSSKKFNTKEEIKRLIEINPNVIEILSEKYQDDVELAKLAVDLKPSLITHLKKTTTEKFCKDKKYCQNLLEAYPPAFQYISRKLRDDKNFVFPYIKNKSSNIEFISKRLKRDQELMSQFIGSYYMMENVGDELKDNEEFMLSVLESEPTEVHKLGPNLKTNIKFYGKAVALNPKIYKYIHKDLQKNPLIIFNVLTHKEYQEREKYGFDMETHKTIDLLPIDIIKTSQTEYNELQFKQDLTLEDFIRYKYMNIQTENELNHSLRTVPTRKIKL